MNAPEIKSAEGKTAKKRLEGLLYGEELNSSPKIEIETTLIKDVDKFDKFGRLLGVIWFNGVNINDWLVAEGLAVVYP
ncbi:MAG: thermonuclease family protein [Pedobacter sp.]|uniref:thermonuclease family protein n=1 Tax=Pedobacter sp. TaxID=1411316 RepID=UPI003568A9DB